MEPEGSLPHLQVTSICPYPQPARSSPYPHISFLENPSKYYPPIYFWFSQMVPYPQVSPPKPCISRSSPPYALHIPPISFFSILLPEQYWGISTDHQAPHYVVFSTVLLPLPSYAQIFSSAPYSQTH